MQQGQKNKRAEKAQDQPHSVTDAQLQESAAQGIGAEVLGANQEPGQNDGRIIFPAGNEGMTWAGMADLLEAAANTMRTIGTNKGSETEKMVEAWGDVVRAYTKIRKVFEL